MPVSCNIKIMFYFPFDAVIIASSTIIFSCSVCSFARSVLHKQKRILSKQRNIKWREEKAWTWQNRKTLNRFFWSFYWSWLNKRYHKRCRWKPTWGMQTECNLLAVIVMFAQEISPPTRNEFKLKLRIRNWNLGTFIAVMSAIIPTAAEVRWHKQKWKVYWLKAESSLTARSHSSCFDAFAMLHPRLLNIWFIVSNSSWRYFMEQD